MKANQRRIFKCIIEKIFNKKEFLFLFFIFGCSNHILFNNSYHNDREYKIILALIDGFFPNVAKTTSTSLHRRTFQISNVTVDDIKKLDNINISEDSFLNSLPDPEIKLTDDFKKANIKISIVKDSISRDNVKFVFSYKVLLEQYGVFKDLLIQYELKKK